MMNFYFYHNFSYIACLCLCIPLLIPFSTINIISIPVDNYNSISVSFKQARHANLGTDKR